MGILDCDDAAVCCLFSFDGIGRDAALPGSMHCCRLLVVVVVMGKFWTGTYLLLPTGEGPYSQLPGTRWYLSAECLQRRLPLRPPLLPTNNLEQSRG